jgi:site-specific recombinase XerD
MRVPEPGFFLKRPSQNEQTAIMMVVRVNRSEILKYYTRESIKPNDWDIENKCAREGKNYPEGWEINLRIQKYRLKFKSIFREMIDKKIPPTRGLIKSKLDEEFFDFLERPSGLVRYFEDLIKRMNENKLLSAEGKPYSPGTIGTFKTAVMHLKKFEDLHSRMLDMEGIDMAFYYDYLDYFYSNNYSTNAIFNPIKKLKQVLKQAEQEGYKVNPAYRNRRFMAPQELTDKIYLTEQNIMAINKHEYELFSQIDNVRDRFVLACCTGIRFSDYEEICEENIFSNSHGEFVRVKAAKTGTVAIIPLNWMAKEILAKYNYKLPKVIGNANFNEYLKKIGEDAKLDQVIQISITRGGKSQTEMKKKYELIQTHTARRSFATNLFLAGYSSTEIMKITGHKTETEFLKYIRVSSEEVAFKMAQDPRFSNRY